MKEPKNKAVNYDVVPKSHDAYEFLDWALDWHDELREAKIALAWRKKLKADVDGRIVLGRCHKISDLHKEFIPFDFVIVLNREYWEQFNDEQRIALMDHELCHAAASLDPDSAKQKYDEKGRPCWRVRKHDIEEFREVVLRHGCDKADLEEFAKVLRSKSANPLFSQAKA